MVDPAEPFKLVLIGDANVGKTSLLSILNGDSFAETYEDWDMKRTTVPFNGVNRTILLTDTAGQERFRELTSASYKNADAVFIVFSVDDKESYSHVEKWIGEVDRYLPNKAVPRILVANKIDLSDRKITTEEAEAFAKSKSMKYLETSAKENKNVQEILNTALSSQMPAKEGGGCCLLQ